MTVDPNEIAAIADRLAKEMSDQGKLVEAGWRALVTLQFAGESEERTRDLRFAYMAGAQHLFGSIMSILDPGDEPTEADLKRMDLIDAELKAFVENEAKPRMMARGKA